jgi:hypothetical protein
MVNWAWVVVDGDDVDDVDDQQVLALLPPFLLSRAAVLIRKTVLCRVEVGSSE